MLRFGPRAPRSSFRPGRMMDWTAIVSSPASDWGAAATYDSTRNVTVLATGQDGGTWPSMDIWELSGSTWTKKAPGGSLPVISWGHKAAYDAARSLTVVVLGYVWGEPHYAGETWVWNGTVWLQKTPAHSPPGRTDFAMAYDANRERVVLFGGSNPGNLADTWEWDGNDWAQVVTAHAPSARSYHSMAYDASTELVYLFGGSTPLSNELWSYNGTDWTQISPPSSPPARDRHHFAQSPRAGCLLLFGGIGAGVTRLSDTWEYSTSTGTWRQLSPSTTPTLRCYGGAAYDSAAKRTVIATGESSSGAHLADSFSFS